MNSSRPNITYEVVAMIIPLLTAYTNTILGVSRFPRGSGKILWKQLTLYIEGVARSLNNNSRCGRSEEKSTHVIDQYVDGFSYFRDELCGVVSLFSFGSAALQITSEDLFSPRTFGRIRDRRERGCRSVLFCVGCQI